METSPEIQLLGLIIKQPDLLDQCQLISNFESPFSIQSYNLIFQHCKQLYGNTGKVDKRELMKLGKENNISLDMYSNIAQFAGFAENLSEYVQQVYDYHIKSVLASMGMNIANGMQDELNGAEPYLQHVRQTLEYIEKNSVVTQGVTLPEAVKRVLTKAVRLNEGDTTDYIETGILALDRIIFGLTKKTMSVIGARPSVGKSALGLTMMSNMAAMGHQVGFISVEMSEEECVERIMQMRSGISMERFKDNNVTHADFTRFTSAGDQIAKSKNMMIVRTTERTLNNIRAIIRRMKNAMPDLSVVFIDYLQKLTNPGTGYDKRTEVGSISNAMPDLANDLDIHVCCLAQINRAGDDIPKVKDLKETGDIEQDAHYIFLIHRDLTAQFQGTYDNDANVFIGKNRGGRTGVASIKYNAQTTRFYDGEHDEVIDDSHGL
jgi:replicative DNA helicase